MGKWAEAVGGRELGQPLWGSPEGARLSPVATTQLPEPQVGASVPCQHPGCWHNSSTGLKQKQGWTDTCPTGVPGPAVHATPCGEGRWLTFSLNSSKPSSRTVMSFWLQRDLRAPAHGFLLRHVARRGWHRCPARGLALDRQHPGSLENRHGAYMRRVPHQCTVGPHSSPLLHSGQVRRTREWGYPHHTSRCPGRSTTCYSRPVSLQYAQCPAERLLRRRLRSCHCFLAASSSTFLVPEAC